jgi:hypothetical protein
MSGTFSPLKVIINPPGVQAGMPGETLELHVVVMNQGNQNAIIDVFLDEAFQLFTQLSIAPYERVALGSQQSIEVSFQVPIPIDTLPGTYDYSLIVDAPQHYPADTPIQYPQQIKVLLKEQTIIREYDPIFSLQPTSNSGHPLIFQSPNPLQIAVKVENRSSRVDSFRLTCPDLEENWFTIRYLTTEIENVGLLAGGTRLELNPTTIGQILLDFHPPLDVFAGSYSFTLQLHSENSPNLVMLDLVYVQIPPVYRLDLKLNTILGQIRRSAGRYEIEIANLGNTVRQLTFSAKTQAEEELCNYTFTPQFTKLLPAKNTVVNLTVKPHSRWKQPLSGTGTSIGFQIDIQDADRLPLTEILPPQTLVWQPRPWWQFWLLILVVLGLLGGLGLIAWILFYPQPLSIENFATESRKIDEGGRVFLNWEVHNSQSMDSLKLATKGQIPSERELKVSELISDKDNSENSTCAQQNKVFSCHNFTTDVREPGKYTFELKVLDRHGKTITKKETEEVEIVAKPEPEVKEIKPDKSTYNSGEKVMLNFLVQHPDKLTSIQILAKTEDGKIVAEPKIERDKSDRFKGCEPEPKKMQLVCQNLPINIARAGKYQLEVIATSSSKKPATTAPPTTKIDILSKALKITKFTLNGSDAGSIVLREGENLDIAWQIDGEEDLQIELAPFGTVPKSGTKQVQITPALPAQISLTASDKYGHKETKGFSIKVEPNSSTSGSSPISPNPNSPTDQLFPNPTQPKPKPPKDLSI